MHDLKITGAGPARLEKRRNDIQAAFPDAARRKPNAPLAPYEVVFCGPIARTGSPARGGYQACNRRTIEALRSAGLTVAELPYPEPDAGGLGKLLAYAAGFVALAWRLRRVCGPRRILHLTGLYKHFLPGEWLLIRIAKALGSRTVYDVRAGSAIRYFTNGTWLYRKLFVLVLQTSDCVMVEGEPYVEFVARLTGRHPHYLPNHVDEALFSTRHASRPARPTLIYLGRIVPEKGIDIVLDAARELRTKGIDCHVVIAGGGSEEYVAELKARYRDCPARFTGPLSPPQVAAAFAEAHFFLFPSSHPGEGHSNALTEAMAAGCVPIASANGFSPSVIGECGHVVEDGSQAALYAEAIARIWSEGSWSALSRCCSLRVRTHFATSRVVGDLVQRYLALAAAP